MMVRISTDLHTIALHEGWDCFQLLQNGSWGPRTGSVCATRRLGKGGIPKHRGGVGGKPEGSFAVLASMATW